MKIWNMEIDEEYLMKNTIIKIYYHGMIIKHGTWKHKNPKTERIPIKLALFHYVQLPNIVII